MSGAHLQGQQFVGGDNAERLAANALCNLGQRPRHCVRRRRSAWPARLGLRRSRVRDDPALAGGPTPHTPG